MNGSSWKLAEYLKFNAHKSSVETVFGWYGMNIRKKMLKRYFSVLGK